MSDFNKEQLAYFLMRIKQRKKQMTVIDSFQNKAERVGWQDVFLRDEELNDLYGRADFVVRNMEFEKINK